MAATGRAPGTVRNWTPAELATAREQTAEAIVAGLTAIHDHPETAKRNRPGLRMAMRNTCRFVTPPAASVPSA